MSSFTGSVHSAVLFLLVLTTTSFTCGGEKAEALIRKNKASSGIIGERRQPQTRPEEAEYGRKQFITYEVEMSISHSDYTELVCIGVYGIPKGQEHAYDF